MRLGPMCVCECLEGNTPLAVLLLGSHLQELDATKVFLQYVQTQRMERLTLSYYLVYIRIKQMLVVMELLDSCVSKQVY